MKYVIDEAVAEKMGLTLPQVLALMLVKANNDVKGTLIELIDKEAIVMIGTPPIRYAITPRYSNLIDTIIINSDKSIPTDKELNSLAEKLMEVFPPGKKPGTPYHWKGNKKDVANRLKGFFKVYGNNYTEEQIVEAAKDYVDSHHGDYTYMKLLIYFIWKKEDGEVNSKLATYLDNAGQENEDDTNWVTELR